MVLLTRAATHVGIKVTQHCEEAVSSPIDRSWTLVRLGDSLYCQSASQVYPHDIPKVYMREDNMVLALIGSKLSQGIWLASLPC